MGTASGGFPRLEAEVPPPYRLVFTGRRGGTSEGPYASLNLGFNTGDHPGRVLANRLRVCAALGVALDGWTLVRQAHSSRVVVVGGDGVGEGARGPVSALGEADAMVTREPGAVLCVLAADCVPVALYGGGSGCMALVHSGWRGTLAGIAGEAVDEMARSLGVPPDEMGATLGPGIRSCCYLVDRGRAASFRRAFGSGVCEEGRLDLYGAIRETLVGRGVREGSIKDAGVCTMCDRDYFSFRRDGETGRQAALLWTEEGGRQP